MRVEPYIVNPDDPRAPPQEVWDRLTPEERDRIVSCLPSEFPVVEEAQRREEEARRREQEAQWREQEARLREEAERRLAAEVRLREETERRLAEALAELERPRGSKG